MKKSVLFYLFFFIILLNAYSQDEWSFVDGINYIVCTYKHTGRVICKNEISNKYSVYSFRKCVTSMSVCTENGKVFSLNTLYKLYSYDAKTEEKLWGDLECGGVKKSLVSGTTRGYNRNIYP